MTEQIHVSAGLDLHKKFIIATLLTDSGFKEQRRFERTESGLFNLKEWTIEHKCEVVACESTSDFWVPICTMMEGHVTVIVGNARDIKMFSHKKDRQSRFRTHSPIGPERNDPAFKDI